MLIFNILDLSHNFMKQKYRNFVVLTKKDYIC